MSETKATIRESQTPFMDYMARQGRYRVNGKPPKQRGGGFDYQIERGPVRDVSAVRDQDGSIRIDLGDEKPTSIA